MNYSSFCLFGSFQDYLGLKPCMALQPIAICFDFGSVVRWLWEDDSVFVVNNGKKREVSFRRSRFLQVFKCQRKYCALLFVFSIIQVHSTLFKSDRSAGLTIRARIPIL